MKHLPGRHVMRGIVQAEVFVSAFLVGVLDSDEPRPRGPVTRITLESTNLNNMLWLRGLLFTLLAPCTLGWWLPQLIVGSRNEMSGLWQLGWLFVAIGGCVYFLCLLRFLSAGGTPAIFFTRHLSFLIGEEPGKLVERGLYRYSRNPMYVGVLSAVLGQAIVFASYALILYEVTLWLFFYVIVVFLEEPHLRKSLGTAYEQYSKRVPRWFGSTH